MGKGSSFSPLFLLPSFPPYLTNSSLHHPTLSITGLPYLSEVGVCLTYDTITHDCRRGLSLFAAQTALWVSQGADGWVLVGEGPETMVLSLSHGVPTACPRIALRTRVPAPLLRPFPCSLHPFSDSGEWGFCTEQVGWGGQGALGSIRAQQTP